MRSPVAFRAEWQTRCTLVRKYVMLQLQEPNPQHVKGSANVHPNFGVIRSKNSYCIVRLWIKVLSVPACGAQSSSHEKTSYATGSVPKVICHNFFTANVAILFLLANKRFDTARCSACIDEHTHACKMWIFNCNKPRFAATSCAWPFLQGTREMHSTDLGQHRTRVQHTQSGVLFSQLFFNFFGYMLYGRPGE